MGYGILCQRECYTCTYVPRFAMTFSLIVYVKKICRCYRLQLYLDIKIYHRIGSPIFRSSAVMHSCLLHEEQVRDTKCKMQSDCRIIKNTIYSEKHTVITHRGVPNMDCAKFVIYILKANLWL